MVNAMKTSSRFYNKGFSLIDAMVAAVVLALGLIAIASFNGTLVSDGSLAMNKAQATSLAQEKIEELRMNALESDYLTLADGSESCGQNTFPCGNAGFTRSWTILDHPEFGVNARIADVTVGWTDPKDNDEDGQPDHQEITLSTLITWENPIIATAAVEQDDFSDVGSIPVPTGGGELTWNGAPDPGDLGSPVENNEEFGIHVYGYKGGVAVFEDGNLVWMTVAPGVVKISGKVDLSTDTPPKQITLDHFKNGRIRAIAADAGICSEKVNQNGTPDDESDDYLAFVCYVGHYWYGRIGIMATQDDGRMIHVNEFGNGQHDRVCPLTYRFGSSCEVTGQYTIGSTTYCLNSDPKDLAHAADPTKIFITGDTVLLAGELIGQNFVIKPASEECSGAIQLSGDITLTGIGGVSVANNVTASVTGSEVSGCTVIPGETTTDPNNNTTSLGTYVCQVPVGWGSGGETLTFAASNCATIEPPERIYNLANTNNTGLLVNTEGPAVTISGCTGSFVTVTGTVTGIAHALGGSQVNLSGTAAGSDISKTCTVSGDTYTCEEIPAGFDGTVEIIAANCGDPATGPVTVEPTATNGSTVTGPDLVLGACSMVNFTIEGFISKGSGSWEAAKNVLVTAHVLENGVECTTATPSNKNTKDVAYSCPVSAYPNSNATISVTAWANSIPGTIKTFSGSPATVPLSDSATITGINFTLQ